MAPPTIEV